MTLHDVDRIFKGWQKTPSPRMMLMAIGSALGIKYQPPKSETKHMTAEEARVFMAQTGGRIEGLSRHG